MEENKNKSKILIIILLIIVIGLVGYLAYDKLILEKDAVSDIGTNCNNQNEDDNNQENQKDDSLKEEQLMNNSYETFKNNLIKSRMEQYNKYYRTMSISSECGDKVSYSARLEANGDLLISYYGDFAKEYNDYKLASNVLSFNIVTIGQGGCSMLYYINSDGTVSSVDTEYSFLNSSVNSRLKTFNNVGNLKNIVSIIAGDVGCSPDKFVCSGARVPLFIDIYGNVYNV